MRKDIRRELIDLAKIAPLSGYIDSGDFRVIKIKEKYNVSNYYVVEVLENLVKTNEIRELDVNYDTDDRHILSFKFR